MNYFSSEVIDENILQGDVFRIGDLCSEYFEQCEKYAVVITADCDIVNNKMGGRFTLLPLITAQTYLEDVWIKEYFNREKNELIKIIMEDINKKAAKHNCAPLDYETTETWLSEESLLTIYEKLEIDINQEIENLDKKLKALSENKIDSYKAYKVLQNKENKIKSELENALKNTREEFYFVPELSPYESSAMFIKMRSVVAIPKEMAFKNGNDIKFSPIDPKRSLIRVGRFSDYLRYSITQKFSNLFSRIGMKSEFENDARDSIAITVDMISGIKK